MKVSLSARIDKNFCIRHNSRQIIAENVDPEKTKDNINWLEPGMICGDSHFASIKHIYDRVFEPSWQEFEKRQAPVRRTGKSYYQTLSDRHFKAKNSDNPQIKDENIAVEFIFQVGNVDTCRIGTENGDKAEILLESFYNDFINRDYVCMVTEKELNDPNWKVPFNAGLILVSAHLHSDEVGAGNGGTKHIHLVAIPFFESERGCRFQSSLGNCFKTLGYPTTFDKRLDKHGNPIQKRDKNNKLIFDENGNPVYKKIPVQKGAIDWLEDQKKIIENDMKEKYDWEREKQTDGRKTYLQIADYKVFKAKEREKELNQKINDLEIDSASFILSVLQNKEKITEKIAEELSQSAFTKLSCDETNLVLNYISKLSDNEREKLLNDIRFSQKSESILEETKTDIEKRLLSAAAEDLKAKIYDKSVKQLWSNYRDSSRQFWSFYNEQKRIMEENKKDKQIELSRNSSLYFSSYKMLYYSDNLIINLLGLLLNLYLKHRKKEILDEIKELTEARKELSEISKSYSADAYNERENIKEIVAQKKLLSSIERAEKSLGEIKEDDINKDFVY